MQNLLRSTALAALFLCAPVAAQIPVVADDERQPDQQHVSKLLEQLSSDDFRERNAATKSLWQIGEALRPALTLQLGHRDPEVRRRLQFVLEMLELGIRPETTSDIRRLIIQASESSGRALTLAAAKLAESKQYHVLLTLAARRQQTVDRRTMLTALLSATRNDATNSTKLKTVYSQLLDLVATEADETTRATLLSQFLGTAQARRLIVDVAWIDRIAKIAKTDRSRSVRGRVTNWVCSRPETILALARNDRLPQWIEIAVDHDDGQQRNSLMSRIIAHRDIRQYLVSEQKLAELVDTLAPQLQPQFLLAVSQQPELHQALSDQLGQSELENCYRAVADPVISARLIGRLFSVLNRTDESKQQLLSELTQSVGDPETKQALAMGVLEGWKLSARTDRDQMDSESVAAIWGMLTIDGDDGQPQLWQLQPLLQCYAMPDVFAMSIGPGTLDHLFALVSRSGEENQMAFARACIGNAALNRQLANENRVLESLQCLRDSSPSVWRRSARSLLASSQVAGSISSSQYRTELLKMIEQEDESIRNVLLQAVIDNQGLLPNLLSDGKFDAMVAIFPAKGPGTQRIDLTGRLLSKKSVVEFLVTNQRTDELLVFADSTFSDYEKQRLLSLLLSSDAVIDAIIESDNFDKIVSAIESLEDHQSRQLLRKLIVSESFVASMLNTGRTSYLLDTIRSLAANERYAALVKLISILAETDLSSEPRLAIELWDLATIPGGHRQQQLAQALLDAPWFRAQLVAINESDNGFRTKLASTPTVMVSGVTRSVVQRASLVECIEQGQFTVIESLLERLNRSARDQAIAALAQSAYLRNWANREDNFSRLVKCFSGIKSPELRVDVTSRLLCQSGYVNDANHAQISRMVIDMAGQQPQRRAAMACVRMLSVPKLQAAAIDSPLMSTLRNELTPLSEVNVNSQLLLSLLAKPHAIESLVTQGFQAVIVNAALAIQDRDQKLTVLAHAMSPGHLQDLLTDRQVKSCFIQLQRLGNDQRAIDALFYRGGLARLIELGFFAELRSIATTMPPNQQRFPSVLWDLLIHPAAIQQLRVAGESSQVLLDVVSLQSGSRLEQSLLQLSNTTALIWILNEHGWQSIESMVMRLPLENHQRFRDLFLRSQQLVTGCVDQADLEPILQSPILASDELRRNVIRRLCSLPGLDEALAAATFTQQFAELLMVEQNPECQVTAARALLANRTAVHALLELSGENDLCRALQHIAQYDAGLAKQLSRLTVEAAAIQSD